mmetsp:Transcript_40370/g.127030  ORF Transcript_40370/g.127030 Transcript_40370/m.127030 type:complete len:297 (+) Transcript_40370:426-1316(+)
MRCAGQRDVGGRAGALERGRQIPRSWRTSWSSRGRGGSSRGGNDDPPPYSPAVPLPPSVPPRGPSAPAAARSRPNPACRTHREGRRIAEAVETSSLPSSKTPCVHPPPPPPSSLGTRTATSRSRGSWTGAGEERGVCCLEQMARAARFRLQQHQRGGRRTIRSRWQTEEGTAFLSAAALTPLSSAARPRCSKRSRRCKGSTRWSSPQSLQEKTSSGCRGRLWKKRDGGTSASTRGDRKFSSTQQGSDPLLVGEGKRKGGPPCPPLLLLQGSGPPPPSSSRAPTRLPPPSLVEISRQ